MFAARSDQENLVYDHQRTAAAKPLNNALGANTPANKAPKTPFRKQLNDENDAFRSGFRTGKKGNDILFTKGKKTADVDKNAFITPAGPRDRAPLGMKTTNAKGAMLKTPAPFTAARGSAQKTVSPRMRRKVKIHHEEPAKQTEAEQEEPDIEYMPPRSIPLPDYPDDFHELNLDVLDDQSFTRAMMAQTMNPVGEDGLTRSQRDMKEILSAAKKVDDETVRKALENDLINGLDIDNLCKYFDEPTAKSSAKLEMSRRPTPKLAPSTISSKRAASALSRPASSASVRSLPRFATSTTTATARSRSAAAPAPAPVSRKTASITAPTASFGRHAAATAASRSTLGYSKGRAVSASARQPLSSLYNRPQCRPGSSASEPAAGSLGHSVEAAPQFIKQKNLLQSLVAEDPEFEELLRERNGAVDETKATREGLASLSVDPSDYDDIFEEDEDLKDFQLVMPELEE